MAAQAASAEVQAAIRSGGHAWNRHDGAAVEGIPADGVLRVGLRFIHVHVLYFRLLLTRSVAHHAALLAGLPPKTKQIRFLFCVTGK